MTPEQRSTRMRELIVAAGMSTREVASALSVSKRTVDCWRAEGIGHRNPPAMAIKVMEGIVEEKKGKVGK